MVFGIIQFSKEGMFISFLCWLVAACSVRLNVSLYQIGFGSVLVYIMVHFLVPYSQYLRDLVT